MRTFLTINLAILYTFCFAQNIVWDGQHNNLLIGQDVYKYEDKSTTLSIEQVSTVTFQTNFVRSEKKILEDQWSHAEGNKDLSSIYWVKFQLDNRTNQHLVLDIAQPLLQKIDLYFADSTGKWQCYKAGYKVNLYEKIVKNQYQVFPLPANTKTFYLRYEAAQLPIPIRIWNKENYEISNIHQRMVHGIYLGLMLFVIFNNLFLFFALRKTTYVHYALLVSFYTCFSSIYEGYFAYFFPNADLMYWYLLLPILNVPNILAFCLLFLNIKYYAPSAYKWALGILIYTVSFIFWYKILPLNIIIYLNQFNSLIGFFIMAGLGVQSGRKGNRFGYYFALAYISFFVIATIEVIFIATGEPAYFFQLSHISLAIFIEVFILAYLLTKRFEWEKEEIVKAESEAQKQLLEKTIENEKIVKNQNTLLERKVEERTAELNHSLENLKATQTQLIQSEKLASLGELTAGIAHEIQNPLNFVNNFSELSVDLAKELKEEIDKIDIAEKDKDYIGEILGDLSSNQEKISHHGKRASSIVKGMLEHSRTSNGIKELSDVNKLADEYLRLSYHGLRAKDKSFNADFKMNFDENLPKINVIPQDLGRVLLNLFNNAFYAVNQRKISNSEMENFVPTVIIHTQHIDNQIIIKVKDNGTGMPESVKEKVFQPFFTTKPTGQGTGLGLSLSYDIITKGHGGTLEVNSKNGEGTEFVITLPCNQ